VQARSAAHGGADVVAVIRATAQSLLDYVPHGPTTEGYGGTYATQENFRIVRESLDAAGEELSRYVMQTNYSSGLCMSEIAWMAAVERLDMLLNDSMYGILFRDINMQRTFVDQYFSRRLIARAKIIVNTGEDNYLTTADAVEAAHTVLSSQFINEAFAHRAGVADEQLGLGHAYEINPWIEDSFLLELAQAQLVRQLFPKHPIKWMPPTKFKTGDIFHSHVHDALYNLVGVTTGQSIELLGMFSEAIHNPLLMDRYLSLKSARYIFGAAKHLGDEIEFKKDGIVESRAREVLANAHQLLVEVERETIWDAIGRGAFADVKRTRTGGKGLAGVVTRDADYVNPLLEALEAG
jgi:beta-lysine 5,6-aminomutase alpha subunit